MRSEYLLNTRVRLTIYIIIIYETERSVHNISYLGLTLITLKHE